MVHRYGVWSKVSASTSLQKMQTLFRVQITWASMHRTWTVQTQSSRRFTTNHIASNNLADVSNHVLTKKWHNSFPTLWYIQVLSDFKLPELFRDWDSKLWDFNRSISNQVYDVRRVIVVHDSIRLVKYKQGIFNLYCLIFNVNKHIIVA